MIEVIINWLITVCIAIIIVYIVRFYVKVYSLPRGPFPLPMFGNALMFRRIKGNPNVAISKLHKTYGPMLTIWMGWTPMVYISDYNLLKTAFTAKDNALMGRVRSGLALAQIGAHKDIIQSDYGSVLASLRRVSHSASRKVAVSEKLHQLVADVVDSSAHTMKKNHALGAPFDPKCYLNDSVIAILASTAFGKRYQFDDKELVFYGESLEFIQSRTSLLAAIDRIPLLRLIPKYSNYERKVFETARDVTNSCKQQYMAHLKTYSSGVVNDFCDALIEAKEKAIESDVKDGSDSRDGRDSVEAFTDNNLSLVIMNLFSAGTDTIQFTMQWIVLLMANNTEMQIQMRDEIESVIGDRVATSDDKNNCHFVNAFIAETMRYSSVSPIAVTHRAMSDTTIDKYRIEKNTLVISNLCAIHMDPNVWPKPEVFDPKRFVTRDGSFRAKMPGFAPFGIGRRVCLGEKLALADLFLITVRLLQSTNECVFALQAGDGSAHLEPEPNVIFFSAPKPYKIILKARE